MIKSNLGPSEKEAKPLKLDGFSISKPKSKVPQASKSVGTPRRSIAVAPAKPAPVAKLEVPKPKQIIPISELAPEQKITRAKHAWENIRVKALDHLRIDQSTRERLAELREEYYRSPSSMKYSEYERSLKDLLGEENFVFLYNAREEFKSRIMDRAQIEIGPHLGEL